MLNHSEIREVVKVTLDELLEKKLIVLDNYRGVLLETQQRLEVDQKLYDFFNNNVDGNGMGVILHDLLDDPYIDVIFLYYRDNMKLEEIAEEVDRDVSTIKRHKRRLQQKIYGMLKEGKLN